MRFGSSLLTVLFFALTICRQCLTGKLHFAHRNLVSATESVVYTLGVGAVLILLPHTVSTGVFYVRRGGTIQQIVAIGLLFHLTRHRLKFGVRVRWQVLRTLLSYGLMFTVLSALTY